MRTLQQLQAIIYGRVQGVNFRYHSAQTARTLELRGWVMNRADGTVEACAVGERAALESFLDWLHHGPPLADVSAVEVSWSDAPDMPDPASGAFEVHYEL